jgi:hypothetical protein
MSATATTLGKAFGVAAAAGAGRQLFETPAVTVANVERRQFWLTPTIGFEIEWSGNEPQWLVPWIHRLSTILNLPQGWDSYDSRKIMASAAFGALNFLVPQMHLITEPPEIFPHRSGGLQLEWRTDDSDLEVLALDEHQYRISYSKNETEIVDDLITNDIQPAIVALKEMAISS